MSANQTTNAAKSNVAKRIFNLIILDESGSMHEHPIRVKTYLEEITKVEEFLLEAYAPNGNTPLFDAMGIALTELEKNLALMNAVGYSPTLERIRMQCMSHQRLASRTL